MITTALALNFKRDKTISAINNFLSSVTYEDIPKRKQMAARQPADLVKIRREITKQCLKNHECFTVVSAPKDTDISKLIVELLNKEIQENKAVQFVTKCKQIKNIILFALFIGIVLGIVTVLIRGVIDAFLFCFIIWILCCLSLWITLKLIIKDWKQNEYGQKN